MQDGARIAYLASPWLDDISGLEALQLTLGDVALHDATGDLLFLLRTRTTGLEEVNRLAAQLGTANAILESRVAQRTQALTAANAELMAKTSELASSEARYRELFEQKPEPMCARSP